MPNTPEADIQVENETVEPYRAVMIFRTLQSGAIVSKSETTKVFPPQTFYAIVPSGKDKDHIIVGTDVESVRGSIDALFPGKGQVQSVPA